MRHHLVVLHAHYLELLLDGSKRIECRLSKVMRPPFRAVTAGDLLWLKLPSHPVQAVAMAGECLFRELGTGPDLEALIDEHGALIGAANGFFENAVDWARFCSLIWIETVVAIQPMTVYKSDQRAWVVLDEMPWPGMRVGSGKRHAIVRP